MKHTIYLFFLVILIFCCSSKEQKTLASNLDLVENVNTINDSILYNIQKRIDSELVNSFVDNKSSNLDSIHSKLLLIKSPISNYWQGYVLYNKALFFYGKKDEDIVKNLLEEAIEVIESSPKSSESYALLGTVQSFKIQFMSGMKAGIMSDKAKENFEKALELDGKNLRSFLGLGSLDFYTPVEYGGKTKAEEYLLKALESPDQSIKNPYLPSWGRNSVYVTIISHYLESKDKEAARKYYKEAIKLFPYDYQVKQLAKKLI